MKKVLLYISLLLFMILPISVNALSNEYKDVLSSVIGVNSNKEKVTIYFFHGSGCPHCHKESAKLEILLDDYEDYIEVKKFEVWNSSSNNKLMLKAKEHFNESRHGVPFTVIGDYSFIGYSDITGRDIENVIRKYIDKEELYDDMNFGTITEDARITLRDYIKYGGKETDQIYIDLKTSKTKFEEAVMKTDYKKINGMTSSEVKAEILKNLEKELNEDIEKLEKNIVDLPIIGKKVIKGYYIPIVAIILGFIDGFNPCAMWILLFIINMLFNMKDKKRMWILGFAFLFTSAFVYFLAMLGLKSILSILAVGIVQKLIALVALIGGIVNLNSFRKDINKKDDGCNVVDAKKRKKILTKIQKFTNEKSFVLALIGVITLALSVNVVELACSAGFPTIFISILEFNKVPFITSIIYMIIYILFYLLDDLIIFIVAMVTLEVTGLSTKYNKYSHLIGGLLMIIIGVLLIFKPELLMFNF